MRDLKPRNAKNPAYKVIDELGLRYFTPMHWVVINGKNGKKERVHIPVIQDLLFIYESRDVLDPVVETTQKLQYRFKRGAGPQAVITIPQSDMERFIRAVGSDKTPIYYTPAELTPEMIGKEIIVKGGPMDGYQGKLLKMQGSKKRRLIVELKGFLAAAVEVNPDYIQLL